MSDLEAVKAMFDRAGIVFEEEPYQPDGHPSFDAVTVLRTREGESPRNRGYVGFATQMGFTAGGALAWIEAWE